jgi:pyrroloquinoline quinone (PQQ) biosynthesis protein C
MNIEMKSASLNEYLEGWDCNYRNAVSGLNLFKCENVRTWTENKIIHFVKIFYHVRGHFHELLWFLGNFAPDEPSKNLILSNIADEFGRNGMSHEKLYQIFAGALGVNIEDEIIDKTTYLPFIKNFNDGYIKWMARQSWPIRLSAFCAIERLDNTDYFNTKFIAETLGVSNRGLAFFNVHIKSNHFAGLSDVLIEIWNKNQNEVKYSFDFVAKYQTGMWRNLSNEIEEYN